MSEFSDWSIWQIYRRLEVIAGVSDRDDEREALISEAASRMQSRRKGRKALNGEARQGPIEYSY